MAALPEFPEFEEIDIEQYRQDAPGWFDEYYRTRDQDYMQRNPEIVKSENRFKRQLLDRWKGKYDISPAIQSEFARAGIGSAIGSFGGDYTLAPGSAGEASFARNLGLNVKDFMEDRWNNNVRDLGIAQGMFPREPQTLSPYDILNLNLANYQNEQQYNQAQYASQLQNLQYQNQQANADSAATGSYIQAGAAALGAVAMMFCWVAREVFGEDDIRWVVFRDWVLNGAPRWFFWFYVDHGKAMAAWIAKHPWSKIILRPILSAIAEHHLTNDDSATASQFPALRA